MCCGSSCLSPDRFPQAENCVLGHRTRPKEPMSLRGAKRRGNLYQTVETQAEGPLNRQEVAAPFGLAMT